MQEAKGASYRIDSLEIINHLKTVIYKVSYRIDSLEMVKPTCYFLIFASYHIDSLEKSMTSRL